MVGILPEVYELDCLVVLYDRLKEEVDMAKHHQKKTEATTKRLETL